MKFFLRILLGISFLIVANHENSLAQIKKYYSIAVGMNQSTFLLDPGFLVEGELERMWSPKLYPSPELSGQINVDFGLRHTLALAADVVYYQRIYSLSLPVHLRYDYKFFKDKNSPFIRLDGGYSFFLTSGAYYGLGLGYRLGKLKTSLAYNNQFRNNSILEDNDFIAARIASLSVKLEFAFRKKLEE